MEAHAALRDTVDRRFATILARTRKASRALMAQARVADATTSIAGVRFSPPAFSRNAISFPAEVRAAFDAHYERFKQEAVAILAPHAKSVADKALADANTELETAITDAVKATSDAIARLARESRVPPERLFAPALNSSEETRGTLLAYGALLRGRASAMVSAERVREAAKGVANELEAERRKAEQEKAKTLADSLTVDQAIDRLSSVIDAAVAKSKRRSPSRAPPTSPRDPIDAGSFSPPSRAPRHSSRSRSRSRSSRSASAGSRGSVSSSRRSGGSARRSTSPFRRPSSSSHRSIGSGSGSSLPSRPSSRRSTPSRASNGTAHPRKPRGTRGGKRRNRNPARPRPPDTADPPRNRSSVRFRRGARGVSGGNTSRPKADSSPLSAALRILFTAGKRAEALTAPADALPGDRDTDAI